LADAVDTVEVDWESFRAFWALESATDWTVPW
jgi:hypothetical protein